MPSPKELVVSLVREALLPSVEAVCTMNKRGRGECWGCPALECKRQVQPFTDTVMDAETITKAVALLRSNRYYIGSTPGRKVAEFIGGDDEEAARALLSELIQCREDFITELALDRAQMGLSTADEAAKLAGYTSYGDHPRNRAAFSERLAAREERAMEAKFIRPGAQRHTHGRPAPAGDWPE